MRKMAVVFAPIVMLALSLPAFAGYIVNPSFEEDFGLREDKNMWGDYGEAFGECYQTDAGKPETPSKARTGDRVLLVNLLQDSWSGAWQQIPWEENTPYAWEAYCLIRGGDLPKGVETFLRAEFFSEGGQVIGTAASPLQTADTGGRWTRVAMSGKTPAGTASIRFAIVAGNNPDGPALLNRIFWDDADTIR